MSNESKIETIIAEGNKLAAKGLYKEALDHFQKASLSYPANCELLYNLANICFILEKPKKTLEIANQAIAANPKFDKALYLIAKTYFYYVDPPKDAIKPILKAIELAPKNSFYYSLAAQIFYSIENIKRAVKLANDAIDIDPDNYEAHLVLGDHYFKEKNLSESTKHYELALNSEIEQDHLYFHISLLHLELAKTTFGLGLIKQALEKNPQDPRLKWLFKYAYMRTQPLNMPFVLLDSYKVTPKRLLYFFIGFVILIGFMYTFEGFCIGTMEVFKWLCSIVFVLYLPYQLIVYILLNIYFHTIVVPKLSPKAA